MTRHNGMKLSHGPIYRARQFTTDALYFPIQSIQWTTLNANPDQMDNILSTCLSRNSFFVNIYIYVFFFPVQQKHLQGFLKVSN